MKIKNINFVFENCDEIMIDGKYIGDIMLNNIKTSIQRVAINAVERMDICEEFIVEIFKEANGERYEFGIENEHYKQMIFDRFADGQDITQIELTLVDHHGKEEMYHYYLKWEDGDEMGCTNTLQKAYLSNPGNLYIVVSDNPNIEDHMDWDTLNDETFMNHKKEMYHFE